MHSETAKPHITVPQHGTTTLYTGTAVLLCAAAVVTAIGMMRRRSVQSTKGESITLSPDFRKFQLDYLAVYLLCSFSDWLKGPYVYALYEFYGFNAHQIAWLFLGGFGASLVVGTAAGALADSWGRRLMCQAFVVLYILSALTKPFNDFWALMLGRVLSGVATSLLFTAFESWMVTEHRRRGFADLLLVDTFSKGSLSNGIGAVGAGFVAQLSADAYGYVAPFLVAVPTLCLAGILTVKWRENYGDSGIPLTTVFAHGMTAMSKSTTLQLIAVCEALFESAMYIWVFYWTPLVQDDTISGGMPYGYIFSAFMAAASLGGVIPGVVKDAAGLLIPLHFVAALSLALPVFFPGPISAFLCFIVFEGCVGAYWAVHATLRSIAIEEDSRSAVMNIIRLPMNAIVVVVLELQLSPHNVMKLLLLMLTIALGCAAALSAAVTRQQQQEALPATEPAEGEVMSPVRSQSPARPDRSE